MVTKKQILGKLKTNLAPNKRNELLREYNRIDADTIECMNTGLRINKHESESETEDILIIL